MEILTANVDGVLQYVIADLPSNIALTGRWQITDWTGSFDPDPVIGHGFSVTNLLPGIQSFVISVSAFTGPVGPATLAGGSAQGGITDLGGGGTRSTSGPGTSFYTSVLDGTDYISLYSDPSSVTVPAFGSGNLSPVESFGSPIPGLVGPAVASSMGIRFAFDLTGGDIAPRVPGYS